MQGKGLIQFFLVTLIIVCLYQLSFTWVASRVEKVLQPMQNLQFRLMLIRLNVPFWLQKRDMNT